MNTWLASNQDSYEFYLLHAMFNDPLFRGSMLGVPLEGDDFGKDEHELLLMALKLAVKISAATGEDLGFPPDSEWMKTCIRTAWESATLEKDTMLNAIDMLGPLSAPVYQAQWVHVNPFFEAWLTTSRLKRYARKAQMSKVADSAAFVTLMQKDINAAHAATVSIDDDEMNQCIVGASSDVPLRRRTGIEGLDEALNGGWGAGECYLLFGGTGSGKSIAAGQCAWFEASNDGWPLVISTELKAREYLARIVSNAATIPINYLQDCENFLQIRQAVAMIPGFGNKMRLVDEILDTIRQRVRIAKVNTDDGLDAKALFYREIEKYNRLYGRYPTWTSLDWLGSMADVQDQAKKGTSERAMAWEVSANGCVKFSDESGIPSLILAQAVNDAQLKAILTISDIGISKGIAKNMVAAIGATNFIDKPGIAAAMAGKQDMPKSMIKKEQFFCMAKARKGEGNNIPVERDFKHQRFVMPSRR